MSSDIRFINARFRVLSENGETRGIGRLAEKSLHRILKYYIEPNEVYHEVKYLGSVADIKNRNGVFEIQTRGMQRLNPKLSKFLESTPVTVVIPLADKKSISWLDKETGELSEPRKSPKSEGVFDAFFELSKISKHFGNRNLCVKLLFLDVSEYRYLNGWDKSKKRGSTRCERIPDAIVSEKDIKTKQDVAELLPFAPEEEFLAKDLKRITKRSSRRNYYILRFLLDTGIISKVREEGRAFVYKRNF